MEAPLTPPRARLSIVPGRPLELADIRLALFSLLWVRGDGGTIVARPDVGTALEDLDWLGIEPDVYLPSNRKDRCTQIAGELMARGVAYQCFCSPAELREMVNAAASGGKPFRYDGRCRRLSANDIDVLRKAGRVPCVRVALPDGVHDIEDLHGNRLPVDTSGLDDFRLIQTDGQPTDVFGDLIDDMDAEATRVLWPRHRINDLAARAVLAHLLEWKVPDIAFLADWVGPDGKPLGVEHGNVRITELRSAGLHPRALLRFAARAGWDPGEALSVEEMLSRFQLSDISEQPAGYEPDRLIQDNVAVLQRIPEEERVAAVVDHLDRRGYSISDRDAGWQARFVSVALPEATTMADVEPLAALLLTPTVDYDREAARVLREPATQQLISAFEQCAAGVEGAVMDEWRDVLTRFRGTLAAPGRGLATLRLVLTGQRNGPNLAAILYLLGRDGIRTRVEKARRYSGA